MYKIEVEKTVIKQVVSKKTGEVFQIPEVFAHVHFPNQRYPVPIILGIERGAKHPDPGMYTLGPDSFYVDNMKSLQLRKALQLIPIAKG